MGRGTSFNEIKAAIEAGERLTRAQGKSLLAYAQMQSERADKRASQQARLEHVLEDARTDLEIEKDQFIRLMRKWNAMIDMLHAFLGYRLHDKGDDIPEQYRQALEKKFAERTICDT